MNLIKPKKLKKGDTIAIIAPAGVVEAEKIISSVKYFEHNGYKVKLGKYIFEKNNNIAGTDEHRLEDLITAFQDSTINAIVCARGGYGSLRLIKSIDYNTIRINPKIFCGYSDISILNAVFLKYANLITFSGPMAQSDFASADINKFMEEEFYKNLTSNCTNVIATEPEYYGDKRQAEGIIFGGNLSTITTLCGVDFIPDEDFIFFAEDLNEPAYKIDRYFTQLMNIDKFFKNVKAVLIGDFLDIDDKKYIDYIFNEISSKLHVPVVTGFPFTHANPKTTLPYGAYAKLNSNILTIDNYLDE